MNIYSCLLNPGYIIYNIRQLMWRFRKIYIMPTVLQIVFDEKYFEIWDPEVHGPRNYLHIFYVVAIIDEYGTTKHYKLAMFRNGI